MTGAMYAAVAGLRAHMNKLNVIANNVSNVNTYGYKSARATFSESLYTSLSSGSNGTSSTGGTNPSQIGYGCNIGTIDLDMSTKNYVPTSSSTDCMINGDGFFMVGDKDQTITDAASASKLSLTRVGNFKFDPSGYLVDGQGNVVYGFLSTASSDGGTEANYTSGNANQTAGISTQLTAIRLPMAAASGITDVEEGSAVYPYIKDGVTTDSATNVSADGSRIQLNSISIDKTGKITGVNKDTKETVVVGYIALASVDNPSGVTHINGPYYRALGGAGNIRVSSVGNAVAGYMNNASTGDVGDMISGSGETELIPNGLESSGTDLANEISEMITTQRGYQANTRIITVTDSMLEELVNMKR